MLNCPKGGCRSSRHTQNLPLHLNAAIFELIHAFDHILLPHNFMMISQMVQQLSCWETDIHTHKQIPLKVIPPLHAITVSVVKIHRQKPSQHRTLDDMFHLSSWYINYCTHSLLSHQSLTNLVVGTLTTALIHCSHINHSPTSDKSTHNHKRFWGWGMPWPKCPCTEERGRCRKGTSLRHGIQWPPLLISAYVW